MNVEVKKATADDINHLVVRQADRDEFLAASGQTPREVILDGIARSSDAFSGWIDGELVCIFGVAPYSVIGYRAAPWLVASEKMYKHRRGFLRYCRAYLAGMSGRYPVLENYVDARNLAAIRWLKWLGFQVSDPAPYGVSGLPFHRFSMRASNV